MLPLYKKTLLVSQTNPTIFQSAETYWDLDDHFDEIIEMQGAYASIDIQIQEVAKAGRKTLDNYTRKMDMETLIIYSAAVLDPRVKTELLKVHLRDNAIDVINDL
jgi:phosphoenolpyruvate synthase/pyruvate phosphate dikinase